MKRLLFTLLLLLIVGPASAQINWQGPDPGPNAVSVEWTKVNFSEGADFNFITSAFVFSGRYGATESLNLVAQVPVSIVSVGDSFGSDAGSTRLANPYLGAEIRGGNGNFVLETGIRLPLLDADFEDLTLLNGFADVDRLPAFVSQALVVPLISNYTLRSASGDLALRLRGGPALISITEEGGDSELALDYGVQGWYTGRTVDIGIEFSGWGIATDEDFSYGESSFHQIGILGRARIGPVEPGLRFLVPLDDDLQEATDFSVGVSLTVPL